MKSLILCQFSLSLPFPYRIPFLSEVGYTKLPKRKLNRESEMNDCGIKGNLSNGVWGKVNLILGCQCQLKVHITTEMEW